MNELYKVIRSSLQRFITTRMLKQKPLSQEPPTEEQLEFCVNCGKRIRGIKSAPRIAIHYTTDARQCVGRDTFAEFEV